MLYNVEFNHPVGKGELLYFDVKQKGFPVVCEVIQIGHAISDTTCIRAVLHVVTTYSKDTGV